MSFLALFSALPWGSLLGAVAAWFQRRQELERMKIEHAQRMEMVRAQAAAALSAAEWAAFTASHHAAAAEDGSGVWPWAKSIRYVTRAALTWILVASAVVLAFTAPAGSDLPARVHFFAELSLGWWFGTRLGAPAARQSTK
jgi:hypothetical protein